MPNDVGYAFSVALSTAIEQATTAFAREDPTAFRYRGTDLRHAVERALFIGLVNNGSLCDAYAEQRVPEAVEGLGSLLERAVARVLLSPERGAGSERPRSRRLATRALWHARARSETNPAQAFATSGPVAFVLDHAKFLPFVEPVRRRLGPRHDVIVSLVPELTRAATQADVDHVSLDGVAGRPPAARAVGIGLLGAVSLLGLFDALLDVLVARRPRCVIMVEGMSPGDEVANRAAHALGIPTLCLQQGWAPDVHVGFRNMSYDAMSVWGQGFADLLAPSNPAQRFVPIGNFSLTAEPGTDRAELAGKLDGRPAVAFFLQTRTTIMRREHEEALLALIERVTQRLPRAAILVREHPAWPVDGDARSAFEDSGIILVDPGRFSLLAVLEAASTAVSIASTCLVEAAAVGCLPIVFNPTSLPRYSPDLEALGAGVEARTLQEAEDAVVRLMEDDQARAALAPGLARFRERFFADDGSTPDKVVELLDELVAANG